jgi:hypothetical protein
MPHQTQTNPELKACIEACLGCYQSCQSLALTHCLQEGGKHVEPGHFRLMMDCAEICRTAATLMMNGSPYHPDVCGTCAEICRACGESCKELGGMEECVRACETCAESCERMAAMGTGARGRQRGAQPQPRHS